MRLGAHCMARNQERTACHSHAKAGDFGSSSEVKSVNVRCLLDVSVVALDYVTLANVLAEDRGADLTVLRFARRLAFTGGKEHS